VNGYGAGFFDFTSRAPWAEHCAATRSRQKLVWVRFTVKQERLETASTGRRYP
jgi:hypothetical protein